MYTYVPTSHQSAHPPSFPILPIIRGHTVSTATSGHVLHRATNARLLSFLTLSSPSCRAKSVNLRPQRTIWGGGGRGEEKPLKPLKIAHRPQPLEARTQLSKMFGIHKHSQSMYASLAYARLSDLMLKVQKRWLPSTPPVCWWGTV